MHITDDIWLKDQQWNDVIISQVICYALLVAKHGHTRRLFLRGCISRRFEEAAMKYWLIAKLCSWGSNQSLKINYGGYSSAIEENTMVLGNSSYNYIEALIAQVSARSWWAAYNTQVAAIYSWMHIDAHSKSSNTYFWQSRHTMVPIVCVQIQNSWYLIRMRHEIS